MKSRNLVVCDTEEEYAKALAMFFMRKKELMLQVHVCSSVGHAEALGKELRADILLAAAECAGEVQEKVRAEKVFVLSTGRKSAEKAEYPALYKYQSGEKMLSCIIQECAELFDAEDMSQGMSGNKKQKIIGVFSPVHRIGKTEYALKLGEKLAETENVLYLNLEVFAGIGGHFKQEGQTLADVLYYARQEKGNLGLMLTTLVCHRGNLDYVLPVPISEDLKEVHGSEWALLVNKILEQSIYETIVLDIGDGIPELYQLLKSCAEVHMPVLEDEYSKAKLLQFEREMNVLGQEDVLKRIVRKGGA
ncbi:hypothetical protein C818_02009 [Lachnospiraceae bacterium MD308]|nr:hypothetical protein C818_02009 [Lachnospiraceae bacterium MD308]